jgi:hypothetical protein
MDQALVEEDAGSLIQGRNLLMFEDQLAFELRKDLERLKVEALESLERLYPVEEVEPGFALPVRDHIVGRVVVEGQRSS